MATYLVTSPLWPLEDIASLPQVPAPLYSALGHPSQTPDARGVARKLTVVAVVIHQDYLLDEVWWTSLKDTENRQKGRAL